MRCAGGSPVCCTTSTTSSSPPHRIFVRRAPAPSGPQGLLGGQGVKAMKACARRYAPDEDAVRWGIAGLLHDFDYEQFPAADQHPYVGSKILEEAGFDEQLRTAIMGHAPYTGVPRTTSMAKALFACDELCGFLVACALVQPSKSMADVKPASVKKKLKDKAFARSVSRDDIYNGATELGV